MMLHRTTLLVAVCLLSFPVVARAQARDPSRLDPPVYLGTGTEHYAGGRVPARMHLERRMNVGLFTAGIMVFTAAYVPWAIDGAVRSTRTDATNLDRSLIWRTIPIVGPFLTVARFVPVDPSQCVAPVSRAPSTALMSIQCVDLNAGMTDGMGGPLQPNWVPRTPGVGDWLWASVLTATQVWGIAMAIWGAFADAVVVPDRPVPNWQWSLSPGGPGGTAGLTLTATHL
jgi:hypothetical protein